MVMIHFSIEAQNEETAPNTLCPGMFLMVDVGLGGNVYDIYFVVFFAIMV